MNVKHCAAVIAAGVISLILILIREGSILVSAVGIHKGDYGSIVIGGRPVDAQELGASMNRLANNAVTLHLTSQKMVTF